MNHARYRRQTALPEIGTEGQARLAGARVLVVGAGGLGSPALLYLAAAGVGTLGVADDDRIEVSNLQRQILYSSDDAGRGKAATACERLAALNPETTLVAHPVRVAAGNALTLIEGYDLVVDASDRMDTKFLVNDACAKAVKPLVYAAALGFEAQVAVFDARHGPCLRCLFPQPPDVAPPTCAEAGILGAVTGIAGSVQALEAVKWIIGAAEDRNRLESLAGRLWTLDARDFRSRVTRLPRDPQCDVCRHPPESIRLPEEPAAAAALEPAALGEHPEALLIDVRERDEWDAGHLHGAIHLPLSRLLETVPLLPERERYVTYCAHGIRSETAAALLARAGYANVQSLRGGLAALETECRPAPPLVR